MKMLAITVYLILEGRFNVYVSELVRVVSLSICCLWHYEGLARYIIWEARI